MNIFSNNKEKIVHIKLTQIITNENQPRTIFDVDKIQELAASIKIHGVLQPIIVRTINNQYEIIAGERRYRACVSLNLETIPAIIKDLNEEDAASVALIENIQREDLTAIEEAKAYKVLMEVNQLKQENLANQLGKSQSTIANKIRLLKLPVKIQKCILNKQITERHARALLMLKEEDKQYQVLNKIIDKQLTVKETENCIKKILNIENKPKGKIISKVSKDARIAINTINHAIFMIKEQSGIELETNHLEDEEFYIYQIKIPKTK
ncbi:nucleoid occlusion protein [Mycoplasmatota bacterium]|nr:nucleoid occlusion protein [Mycoplasmatota bacterium]